MKLTDAYFGIKLIRDGELVDANLFDSIRVLDSITCWKLMSKSTKRTLSSDLIHFCFGDTMGRYEYEMMVGPLMRGEPQKVDIFQMYVLPNAKLLEDMVKSISVSSAREYKKSRSLKKS